MLDELGFTSLNKLAAGQVFRIVSECYGRGSIIITSNKLYEQWTEDQRSHSGVLVLILESTATTSLS